MANIKSAKKRIKVLAKKNLVNKMVKSRTKTAVKRVYTAVSANDKQEADAALKDAFKYLDKAATKGVMHKNAASRKKSRLTKLINKTV